MKTFCTLILLILVSIGTNAQQPSEDDIKKTNSFIRFEPSELNLGSMAVNDINDDSGKREIDVYNDGALPLILSHVSACCGTQVREWPRQPIAPGQKGTIKIYFRVNPNPHRISRTVTVQSNAGNGNVLKVAILGEVVIPKAPNEIKLP